jgi:hypothetical protein
MSTHSASDGDDDDTVAGSRTKRVRLDSDGTGAGVSTGADADADAGAGGTADAGVEGMPVDLLPAEFAARQLAWATVFPNPKMLAMVLNIVTGVLEEDAVTFTVTKEDAGHGAVTMNILARSGSVLVLVYVPCPHVLVQGPDPKVEVAVPKVKIKEMLSKATGALALYQTLTGPDSARVQMTLQTAMGGRHMELSIMAPAVGFPTTEMHYGCQLSLVVSHFHGELVSVGTASDGFVDIEVCDAGGKGDVVLVLRGEAILGVSESYIFLPALPEALAGAGAGAGAGGPGAAVVPGHLQVHAQCKCRMDSSATRKFTTASVKALPRRFVARYKLATLTTVLQNMRGESMVDVCLGGAGDQAGNAVPMLLRMPIDYLQGGYIAFAIAPKVDDPP